jgi:hypothetical protein
MKNEKTPQLSSSDSKYVCKILVDSEEEYVKWKHRRLIHFKIGLIMDSNIIAGVVHKPHAAMNASQINHYFTNASI